MSPPLSDTEYGLFLRHDFMTFIERSFYELNPQTKLLISPYIELLASKLEACRAGRIKRLIINLPPRMLKSHAASVAFPAWILGHSPSSEIICASYGQELADKHARDCRTVMASTFFQNTFPRTTLAQDKRAVNDFMTTDQGCRMSTSVGGVLTGRGADYLILDDVLKPEDALSDTRRKAANDWFDNTLRSRLNSKENGVIIIVMQRLHQDDLVGHVCESDEWQIVALPAIAEEEETYLIEDYLGKRFFTRNAGEVLHPERDSKETMQNIRKSIPEYDFQSQYQQNPMPQGGSLIRREWLKYYEVHDRPKRFSLVLQSWDTANKSGELNDYSVCTTWGVSKQRFYLLDVFRCRLNYPELKRAALYQYLRYKPHRVLIEDKASGTQLIQELRGSSVLGVLPYEPPPGNDKIVRVYAQTIRFADGSVLLPTQAPWLEEYTRELLTFPGSKYDDQVDSTTQALDFLGSKARSLLNWERL